MNQIFHMISTIIWLIDKLIMVRTTKDEELSVFSEKIAGSNEMTKNIWERCSELGVKSMTTEEVERMFGIL